MAEQFLITDAGSGDTFLCGEDESLFAAMLRTRKGPIRYGCAGGGCGVCKVRILEGEVRQFKPMSRRHVSVEEEGQGYYLACCIKPNGSITLTKG